MDKKVWQGRPIVHDSHREALETAAAIKEFEHGFSREDAESEAYAEYAKENHLQAAAHHLRGLRAAQANADMDEAQKHGVAYGIHMGALGYDPMDQVPEDVQALVTAEDRKPAYKFKAHAADRLLLDLADSSKSQPESESSDTAKEPHPPAPKDQPKSQ